MATKWYRVVFKHAVTHLVSARLLRPLVRDLDERNCPVLDIAKEWPNHFKGDDRLNPRRVTSWGIDMPGMAHKDAPQERFRWCDLELEIPSEDVAAFVGRLGKMEVRAFVNAQFYFKLHGFQQAIVMSKRQYAVLVDLLRQRLPAAERRATEFWAGRQTPGDILREAQPQAAGIDLGGHKQDRFAKPRGGGTA